MLSYYIVPVWLNYPSNLANGHLAGSESEYAIDGREGRGGGGKLFLFVFYYKTISERLGDKMLGLIVGVTLSKATLTSDKSIVELMMTN